MFNLLKKITSIDPGIQRPAVLFQVIPPKYDDFSAQGFINVMEALNIVDDLLSFEIVATNDRILMYVRSSRPDHVISTLQSRYAQIRFETVPAADDPLLVPQGTGTVFRQVLWTAGDDWLPLQVQDDAKENSDPFVEMVGGLSAEIPPGGRIVTRLLLSEKDRDWSERWRSRAISGSGSANQKIADAARREEGGEAASGDGKSEGNANTQHLQVWVASVVGLLIILGAYVHETILSFWMERRLELIAYGVLALMALTGVGYVLHRLGLFKAKPELKAYDSEQVKLRVVGAAFRLEVQIFALLPEDGERADVMERVLRPVVASYRRFDSPMGARFEAGPVDRLDGFDPNLDDIGFVGVRKDVLRRTQVGEGVVGTREAVALWHVPGDTVDAPSLVRAGSRRLPVPQEMFVLDNDQRARATLVGFEKYLDGGVRQLYFPDEALRRHHLYVARTRMGKTTLMRHVARSLLRSKAAGLEDTTLVVVDPHSDLVADILNGMPVGAAADVRLIDVGDPARACGINLLDVHTFTKRDMTISTIIAIAKATSSANSWGDRMESILEWSLIALYEANRNRDPDEQYTIFDTIELLTDETRRQEIISEGRSVDVAQWWYTTYPTLVPHNDRSAIAPVLRKIGQYASVEAARRVLGQRRCTLDIEGAIQSGKVLLVDTARARSGHEVSSILGASILNLVQNIIERQSQVPIGERRRIVVVVDEMQTLLGVTFDEMLAELSKYNGSLIMATQSLDRLNTMTENGRMRETILSNIGCLVAFQTNFSDAAILQHELRGDALDEQDIIDLPPHHCYGRLTLESGNVHFSTEVIPPFPGNGVLADLSRQDSDAYTRPTVDVDAEHKQSMEGKFREYFGDPDNPDDTFDFGSGS